MTLITLLAQLYAELDLKTADKSWNSATNVEIVVDDLGHYPDWIKVLQVELIDGTLDGAPTKLLVIRTEAS